MKNPPRAEAVAKRQQKLHDISAAVFAKRVLDFYEECQNRLDQESALKQQQRRRLFHRSRRL
ncbi:hypothetical protein FC35_GL000407 [Limosilactobacillus coleohominis DSM 14060]|nr:hypothetical protein FC35_GL000407 [Limosilactobacillus coleohominis DSM 14060]